MASETITIGRAGLTAEVSRAFIESLNAELGAIYPEPGATHFRLDPDEVAGDRGAFFIVYKGDTHSTNCFDDPWHGRIDLDLLAEHSDVLVERA